MSLSQLFLLLLALLSLATAQQNDDASVMLKLRDSLNNPSSLSWTGSDPCNGWAHVQCSSDNRVTRIQIGSQKLTGTLPPQLSNLTQLTVLEVMNNQLTGSVPSLSGLNKLQTLLLYDNSFTSFRSDFFRGLSSLITVSFDNNPFQRWEIPASLADATSLKSFSAANASINGKIPSFLNNDVFPELNSLRLSYNYLEGEIPANFSGSMIQFLWLNGQNGESKLNGSVGFLGGMSNLLEVWLQGNAFTGPLPDLSGLSALRNFSVRDNQLTGIVPDSLVNLASLSVVNLTNNLFQGRMPAFPSGVVVDVWGINSFCLNTPGTKCDARVDLLLSVAKEWNYPASLAQSWKGNDPCVDWYGISCSKNDIIVVNLQKRGLAGNISSIFSLITPLQRLILSNNLLSGTIPSALTTLPSLTLLDVSNNLLFGTVPNFRQNVQVITKGNVDIGKNSSSAPPGTTPAGSGGGGGGGSDVGNAKKSATGKIVGGIAAGVVGLGVVFALVFFLSKNKKRRSSKVQSPNTVVIHPRHSGDHDEVKITVAESSASRGAGSYTDSGPSDIHVEAGNMVISIQVLKNVTNNFSKQNILGKGGFGTVYKGELHDGTKIAVKRMESSVVSEKGLTEFMSEIKVLNKVRHRHLVALLGYCLEGAEKLLVYEYMPQGTLGRYLFNWKEEGLEPLDWKRRLTIALDVARGVEYLHSLAQQSFIHRDLKPSNILLGDDMRAKVSDFGLVRLAPEGKASFETRLAGTFGYLAPEYAVTGRVTTKVDVFSFGVILMEMITGRRALDENQPEDSMHLVSWFRRMTINKDSFNKAIDPTLELDEETLVSIKKVAELAGHCTAREPYQRPDMGHVVNVLSSLAELWKPSEPDSDDIYGIDLDMTLPQALKKWQAFEGSNLDDSSSSSYFGSGDNTQTSIPTRPSGFAESFTSADGR